MKVEKRYYKITTSLYPMDKLKISLVFLLCIVVFICCTILILYFSKGFIDLSENIYNQLPNFITNNLDRVIKVIGTIFGVVIIPILLITKKLSITHEIGVLGRPYFAFHFKNEITPMTYDSKIMVKVFYSVIEDDFKLFTTTYKPSRLSISNAIHELYDLRDILAQNGNVEDLRKVSKHIYSLERLLKTCIY